MAVPHEKAQHFLHFGKTPKKKPNWRKYYTPAAREIVSIIYGDYIKRFGYTFDTN
jgi:hypothetical protein